MQPDPVEPAAERPRYVIQSLARGLALLDCVRSSPTPPSLVNLSEHLSLNLVTTFRLMYTLEQAQYVRRDPDTRRYYVGASTKELQCASPSVFDYVQAATPYLEELRGKADGVGLGVLEGTHVRNLTRIFHSRLMADSLSPGSLVPAHATSLGKVLLGALPASRVRELYAGEALERYTPYTITSVDRLLREVSRAQRLGFAISVSENRLGVRSAAAPVKNAQGVVIAAITVTTTTPSVSRRELAEAYAPLAIMAAEATSARLAAMIERALRAAV